MEFATRQEGMIIPKLGDYGKYIAVNINKFRPEQKKALFSIIRKLELIHEDMGRISSGRTKVKVPPVANTGCFRFVNDFVRTTVCDVVETYYLGSAANLTLMETTFYDHNLLLKRNSHTAFLKALIGWGALPEIDEDALSKIANSMAFKMRALPTSGYKEWNGKDYINDKKICSDIGKKLIPTIPYSRKKET
jgi:hypothetical protein